MSVSIKLYDNPAPAAVCDAFHCFWGQLLPTKNMRSFPLKRSERIFFVTLLLFVQLYFILFCLEKGKRAPTCKLNSLSLLQIFCNEVCNENEFVITGQKPCTWHTDRGWMDGLSLWIFYVYVLLMVVHPSSNLLSRTGSWVGGQTGANRKQDSVPSSGTF